MRVFSTRAAGHAIVGVIITYGCAKDAVAGKEAGPAIDSPCLACRIGNHASLVGCLAQFFRLFHFAFVFFFIGKRKRVLPQFRGNLETTDLKIIGISITAIDMEHDALTHGQVNGSPSTGQIACRIRGDYRIKMNGFIRNPARYAFVDHIDSAADRLTAKQQNRRSAQNFDPLSCQRLDRGRVVGRGIGHISCAQTVDQYLHPLALKPAQDRARCAGCKAGGRYAG